MCLSRSNPNERRVLAVKSGPKRVAMARELRDRFWEHVNEQRFLSAEMMKYEWGGETVVD